MFTENLTEFMDTQTGFAEAVIVGGIEGVGIFDLLPRDALGMIESSDPSLLLIEGDFPAAAVGDSVTVRNTAYSVAARYPDGTGLTRLVLK